MHIRAVRVRPNPVRNFVPQIAEKQKQATPVPVPIRDAELSLSRSSPHWGHKAFTNDEVSMAWSNHGCGRVSRLFSSKRWPGKVSGLVATAILILLPALAISAAGGSPPAPPESGGGPVPGIPPEKRLESGVPPIPPSQIDPGIHHMPEERGDPRGAVKPPNLDPGIAMNPDVAPPARQGINPPTGGASQAKPYVR